MTTSKEDILGFARQWILSRLLDRETLTLPLIGTFAPVLSREYLFRELDGTVFLYPPSISLSFRADAFLLDTSRYLSFDFNPPKGLVSGEFTRVLSDFYDLEEKQVSEVLLDYLSGFMTRLFRGRRVSLFTLGDFFVTEESGRLLVLNFEPSPECLETLNHPFSAYTPIQLPEGTDLEGYVALSTKPATPKSQFPVIDRTKEPTVELEEIKAEAQAPSFTEQSESVAQTLEENREEKKEIITHSEKTASIDPRNRRPLYMLYIPLVGILVAALFFLFPKNKPTPQTTPGQADTLIIEEQPVLPVTAPIVLQKDTIDTGETLVKLARKYYDIKEYWVYLYIHNKALIKNPDNIPVGTVLEIPDLKVFGLKSDREASIREAKDWAFIIQTGGFDEYDAQRPSLPSNRQ